MKNPKEGIQNKKEWKKRKIKNLIFMFTEILNEIKNIKLKVKEKRIMNIKIKNNYEKGLKNLKEKKTIKLNTSNSFGFVNAFKAD